MTILNFPPTTVACQQYRSMADNFCFYFLTLCQIYVRLSSSRSTISYTYYYSTRSVIVFQHDRCQSLTELNKEPPAVPSEKVGQINFGLEYDYQQNTLILRIIAVRLHFNQIHKYTVSIVHYNGCERQTVIMGFNPVATILRAKSFYG